MTPATATAIAIAAHAPTLPKILARLQEARRTPGTEGLLLVTDHLLAAVTGLVGVVGELERRVGEGGCSCTCGRDR